MAVSPLGCPWQRTTINRFNRFYHAFTILRTLRRPHESLWDGSSDFGFTGEQDQIAGLVFLRARYYDPSTGRFITKDPFPGVLSLPSTLHPYQYALNNPINLVDPSGEFVFAAIIGGILIGGGLAAFGFINANPGYTLSDYLSSGCFWRAVGIGAATGIIAGLVGGFIGGLGIFGLGLKGAILSGMASGLFAGLASECLRQYLKEGGITDPLGVLVSGGVGLVTGGIFGAIGYKLSGNNTLWRILRNRDIEGSQVTANAFRPDKYGELSVFRGPKWIVNPLVRSSRLFRDVGGLAQISRESVGSAGMSVIPRYDPNLGPILGRLHENIIYSSEVMTKAEFGRKILSLIINWSR